MTALSLNRSSGVDLAITPGSVIAYLKNDSTILATGEGAGLAPKVFDFALNAWTEFDWRGSQTVKFESRMPAYFGFADRTYETSSGIAPSNADKSVLVRHRDRMFRVDTTPSALGSLAVNVIYKIYDDETDTLIHTIDTVAAASAVLTPPNNNSVQSRLRVTQLARGGPIVCMLFTKRNNGGGNSFSYRVSLTAFTVTDGVPSFTANNVVIYEQGVVSDYGYFGSFCEDETYYYFSVSHPKNLANAPPQFITKLVRVAKAGYASTVLLSHELQPATPVPNVLFNGFDTGINIQYVAAAQAASLMVNHGDKLYIFTTANGFVDKPASSPRSVSMRIRVDTYDKTSSVFQTITDSEVLSIRGTPSGGSYVAPTGTQVGLSTVL